MSLLTGAINSHLKALTSKCDTEILGCRQEQLWISRCDSLNAWLESIKWSCAWVQTTISDYIKKKLVSSFQRHRATGRKDAGSIADGVIAIFHWHNPSGCVCPWSRLSFWQKWAPGIPPRDKAGRCLGLKTLPPSCADYLEILKPQFPGTLSDCPGL